MIDLEQPNLLRLYNIDEEIRDALKSAVIRIQPHLEQISDANDYSEFRWKDPVWNHVASKLKLPILGVKIRNMKMDLNIYGTWRRVGQ